MQVGVEEVDLHLSGADFVDQRVHVQLHLVAVVVDVLEQRVELVDRVDGISLARGFRAAAAAHRRLERHVGVGVAGHQVELELRRHHRVPALGGEQVADAAQHRAGGEGHQLAIAVVAVVHHLGGGVGGPGHDAHGGRVRPQVHVVVHRADHVVVRALFRELAGHAHGDDRLGQPHAAVFGELLPGQDLAAGHTGQVGHQAFDLGDVMLVEPVFELEEIEMFFAGHEAPASEA